MQPSDILLELIVRCRGKFTNWEKPNGKASPSINLIFETDLEGLALRIVEQG
jgi:type IV secretory pathway VirB9-like protein